MDILCLAPIWIWNASPHRCPSPTCARPNASEVLLRPAVTLVSDVHAPLEPPPFDHLIVTGSGGLSGACSQTVRPSRSRRVPASSFILQLCPLQLPGLDHQAQRV